MNYNGLVVRLQAYITTSMHKLLMSLECNMEYVEDLKRLYNQNILQITFVFKHISLELEEK